MKRKPSQEEFKEKKFKDDKDHEREENTIPTFLKDGSEVVRLWQEEMVKTKIPCRSVDASTVGFDEIELPSDVRRALNMVPVEWSDDAVKELVQTWTCSDGY